MNGLAGKVLSTEVVFQWGPRRSEGTRLVGPRGGKGFPGKSCQHTGFEAERAWCGLARAKKPGRPVPREQGEARWRDRVTLPPPVGPGEGFCLFSKRNGSSWRVSAKSWFGPGRGLSCSISSATSHWSRKPAPYGGTEGEEDPEAGSTGPSRRLPHLDRAGSEPTGHLGVKEWVHGRRCGGRPCRWGEEGISVLW